MTRSQKIILAAVGVLFVAIFLVLVAFVLRQQKSISYLSGKSGAAPFQTSAKKSSGSSLVEAFKQFSGTIESISGNQLIISTKLVDFSKPKNPEKFKNTDSPMEISVADFEMVEKKITVNTKENTVFLNKKLPELKAGDTVSIDSNQSPYTTDTVMAEKVTSVAPK